MNNECTKEELEELLDHIQVADDKLLEDGLEEEWNNLLASKEIEKKKSEKIFRRIIEAGGQKAFIVKPFFYKNIYAIAASFIGFLLFTTMTVFFIHSNQFETRRTGYAEIREIILPDNSKVTLNSNSTIRYKKEWNEGEERIVTLEGEAFFSVSHKRNNEKFIVQTNEVNVEVLGTEFNVVNRRSKAVVVLEKGKVKLDVKGSDDIVMEPGQLVEVNAGKASVNTLKVNPKNYSSYRMNLLTFQSNTLEEIAEMIEDNYGQRIIIEDKELAQQRFSGAFPADENIALLLNMLSKSYDFKIEKDENRLIFKENK